MIEKKHLTLALSLGVAALVAVLPTERAQAAEPERNGVQLEGMIGGAGCIPGRAPCRYDTDLFSGYTQPSFGTGVTLGWRARRWLLLGAAYRLGMFQPNYDGPGSDYRLALAAQSWRWWRCRGCTAVVVVPP